MSIIHPTFTPGIQHVDKEACIAFGFKSRGTAASSSFSYPSHEEHERGQMNTVLPSSMLQNVVWPAVLDPTTLENAHCKNVVVRIAMAKKGHGRES